MQMFQIKVGLQSHYGQVKDPEQIPLPPAQDDDIIMQDEGLEKNLTQVITKLKKNRIALLADIDKLSEQFIQMSTHASEKLAYQIGYEDIDKASKNSTEYQVITTNTDKEDPFIQELSDLSECL